MKDAHTSRTVDCRLLVTASKEQGWTSEGVCPFPVRRVYFMQNMAPEVIRGDHAHRALMQLVVAVRGSFDVCLKDGREEHLVHLNCPNTGLLLCAGVWKEMRAFSTDAVCLVLASELFSEQDYIRSWNDFIAFKKYSNPA